MYLKSLRTIKVGKRFFDADCWVISSKQIDAINSKTVAKLVIYEDYETYANSALDYVAHSELSFDIDGVLEDADIYKAIISGDCICRNFDLKDKDGNNTNPFSAGEIVE